MTDDEHQKVINIEYLNDFLRNGTTFIQSEIKRIEKRLKEMNNALKTYLEMEEKDGRHKTISTSKK